ncbi:hypothetical protein QTO34_002051 [Cnephaeus nilssonii]|uniref:Uncharacterized protein n=1 Tax=Cnephaeus nilssonii TaxID=3371016 RepID=A0AA40LLH3_CNENI|nr:hypothetical protein QTO34_002051 [Eptesicus nilssonii]
MLESTSELLICFRNTWNLVGRQGSDGDGRLLQWWSQCKGHWPTSAQLSPRGRERDRELETLMREKHRSAASCTPPTGDVPAAKSLAWNWSSEQSGAFVSLLIEKVHPYSVASPLRCAPPYLCLPQLLGPVHKFVAPWGPLAWPVELGRNRLSDIPRGPGLRKGEGQAEGPHQCTIGAGRDTGDGGTHSQ